MSFPQLGYPQYLSASQAVYGAERAAVLAPSSRGGSGEAGAGAPVASVLGVYAHPYAHPNYGAFLPYASADLALFSQMGSQYELKDSPGVHPASFAAHTSPAFYPYGQFQYGDPARPKNATRESTSTLKAWLNEHRKNPYPTKGEKIMLAIITKMTLTQVSTWFANARRRLKKENKVTWGRSKEDEDGNIFHSDNEGEHEKNEDEEEIDLESIDIDKIDENDEGEQSHDDEDEQVDKAERKRRVLVFDQSKGARPELNNNNNDDNNNSSSSSSSSSNSTRVSSPGGQGSFQLQVGNKPKIWSLAETATSPDSSRKPASPCGPTNQVSPQMQHPAFLSSHGLYTCQIGKFHNWTNGGFLGQNALLNVRSFLGVSQHHHNHHGQQQQQQQQQQQHQVTALDDEKSPEDLSPKHIDRGIVLRNESPTQHTNSLKSSFRPLHDSPRRNQQEVSLSLSSA